MSFFGQLFFRQKSRPILNNFGSIFGPLAEEMSFFLVNFWPIYAKNGHFLKAKKEANCEQFLAHLCKKMAFFLGKKRRQILSNFLPILGQFALKKWPFFKAKKRRPILNNSGSIFGQFIQKNGHFSKAKKEANCEQFLAHLCKKMAFFLGKKKEANFEQFWANLL